MSFSGWIYELSERLHAPIINKTINVPDTFTSYISSLYFTTSSLTSVGFGNVSANTVAEKLFSICAMLVGGKLRILFIENNCYSEYKLSDLKFYLKYEIDTEVGITICHLLTPLKFCAISGL